MFNIDAYNAGDIKMVEAVANAAWLVAMSENREIAVYNSTTYISTHTALRSAAKSVFRLTDEQADSFMEIFVELGPNDGWNGSTHYGVTSYADYAINAY